LPMLLAEYNQLYARYAHTVDQLLHSTPCINKTLWEHEDPDSSYYEVDLTTSFGDWQSCKEPPPLDPDNVKTDAEAWQPDLKGGGWWPSSGGRPSRKLRHVLPKFPLPRWLAKRMADMDCLIGLRDSMSNVPGYTEVVDVNSKPSEDDPATVDSMETMADDASTEVDHLISGKPKEDPKSLKKRKATDKQHSDSEADKIRESVVSHWKSQVTVKQLVDSEGDKIGAAAAAILTGKPPECLHPDGEGCFCSIRSESQCEKSLAHTGLFFCSWHAGQCEGIPFDCRNRMFERRCKLAIPKATSKQEVQCHWDGAQGEEFSCSPA